VHPVVIQFIIECCPHSVSYALFEALIDSRTCRDCWEFWFSGSRKIHSDDITVDRDDKVMQRLLFFSLLNNKIHWQQGGYVSTVTDDQHLDRLVAAARASAVIHGR
jgi:hypothetical protein